MATITVTPITASAASNSVDVETITSSGGTVTIDTDDFSKMAVRVSNTSTTESMALSITASDDYSGKNLGASSITVSTAGSAVGGLTATTVVVGGLESATYKTSGGTLEIVVTSGPTGFVEAILASN